MPSRVQINLKSRYSAAIGWRAAEVLEAAVDPELGQFFLDAVLRQAAAQGCGNRRWSISWSWLKQENTTVSVPVTGSRWRCRHCAQISFIMHCIGELIDAIARWSGPEIGLQARLARLGDRVHHAVGADRDDAVDRVQRDRDRPERARP